MRVCRRLVLWFVLAATFAFVCRVLVQHLSGPNLSWHRRPFDERAWKMSSGGNWPGSGPQRSEMFLDVCQDVRGKSVVEVLNLLGAPDVIGDVQDPNLKQRGFPVLKGACLLCYSFDPHGEWELNVSILKEGGVEDCFPTFWSARERPWVDTSTN